MHAIILAAGAGTRLRPITADCPKCLVPIDARTLLDHQIDALLAAGVDAIHIVVGYRAAMVRQHCGHGERYGARIDYYENVDWQTTNSIYSLYVARQGLQGDVFLCNCDILFDARLSRRLARARGSCIAMDTDRPRLAGEMNIRLDAGKRVTAIGKQLDPSTTCAVSAQMVLLRDTDAETVASEVVTLVEGQATDAFPTAAYGRLIEASRLEGVDVADLPWAEIDSVEEYEQARHATAPQLLAPGDEPA